MLTHLHDGMDNKYQGCFADVEIVLYTVFLYKMGLNSRSCKIYMNNKGVIKILFQIYWSVGPIFGYSY